LTDNPMRPAETMVRSMNMNNVVEMPYCVAHPKLIDKLISAGYLRPSERHRAEAVKEALDRLRKRSKERMEEEWR
jgi:hypothetical protein